MYFLKKIAFNHLRALVKLFDKKQLTKKATI